MDKTDMDRTIQLIKKMEGNSFYPPCTPCDVFYFFNRDLSISIRDEAQKALDGLLEHHYKCVTPNDNK